MNDLNVLNRPPVVSMGLPIEPKPIKLFAALLATSEDLLASVEARLAVLLGAIESRSAIFPWEVTDYYAEEMGGVLRRGFVSFARLASPEGLPEIKLSTQGIEAEYLWTRGGKRGRQVNIDPGYLDAGKVVLASTKNAAHRLYLRSGIYGEVTLLYRSGFYHPLDTTYADYRWPQTIAFFGEVRGRYLAQLKGGF